MIVVFTTKRLSKESLDQLNKEIKDEQDKETQSSGEASKTGDD
jgi:hypothetical protein